MLPLPVPLVNAMIWRNYRPNTQRLRIGVLIDDYRVPDWIFQALTLLESEPALDLTAILIHDQPLGPPPKRPALFRLLQDASLKRADVLNPFHDLTGFVKRLADAPALDILVRFDTASLHGPSTQFAKFGVWSIGLGESPDVPYFKEVKNQAPVSVLGLRHHPKSMDEPIPFYDYRAPTVQGLCFTKNSVEPCRMAGLILLDRLLDVAARGYASVICQIDSSLAAAGDRSEPTDLSCFGFVLRRSARSISGRLRSRNRFLRWVIAIRAKNERAFREIPAPTGHGHADPFLLEWNGNDYLLMEDVPLDGLGRLAAMKISPDGTLGEPELILERPYHLSYPFVFQNGSDLFLIPESANNRTVELYRAGVRAPFEWHFEKHLFEGAMLVDTTVFHHDGIWYFFTTQVDYGMRAYLFYADSLDGEWKYHPRNPICSDVARSRGAGKLFYRNGRLLRPAQDCSVRYGYAIVLNEVRKLSRTEYEESPIERLEPSWWGPLSWRNANLGTHTLNASARWEVTDGLRLRL